jgi:hypothetical protein
MNTKTKSAVVLLSVLIIGIVIGALGSTLLRRNLWQDRVERFRTPHGFTERLLNTINPEPDKREKVYQILLEHHTKMLNHMEQTRDKMKIHGDSLLLELKPLLTEEQLNRVEKLLKRGPRGFPRPGGRPAKREKY